MDQQLLAFVTVVERQNFTRAAEQLHISQPAISQHIHALEDRLDMKLLERNNKFVQVNKAGEVAVRYAREILKLYQQMEQSLEDLRSEASGTLDIGSSFTFGEYILPHIIADFRLNYPKVTANLSIENTHTVVSRVAQGELDIGIIEGRAFENINVDIEPFAEDRVVIVASGQHPLTAQAQVTPEQLESEHWIIREHGSGTREITDYVFGAYGIQPKTWVEYSSTQVIKESVEAGLGLSILSKWAIRKELAWNLLQEISVTDIPIRRPFSIVLKKSDFHTKATRLFQQYLYSQVPKINQQGF